MDDYAPHTCYQILISTFDTEQSAFEGLSALKDLHRDGDITVYASSVIAKDPQGAVSVPEAADSGPVGTLVGVVTGASSGCSAAPPASRPVRTSAASAA
jgi:uncharacterized membrane protein